MINKTDATRSLDGSHAVLGPPDDYCTQGVKNGNSQLLFLFFTTVETFKRETELYGPNNHADFVQKITTFLAI